MDLAFFFFFKSGWATDFSLFVAFQIAKIPEAGKQTTFFEARENRNKKYTLKYFDTFIW